MLWEGGKGFVNTVAQNTSVGHAVRWEFRFFVGVISWFVKSVFRAKGPTTNKIPLFYSGKNNIMAVTPRIACLRSLVVEAEGMITKAITHDHVRKRERENQDYLKKKVPPVMYRVL